jgi:SAM-dependent methyltransferase
MAFTVSDKKNVLHVGCGPRTASPLDSQLFPPTEWHEIRLDIDPDAQPDIVASITDMSMVDSDSMDGIFSSHNLEHLYSHEVPLALREFFRVLKPGGVAIIRVPNLQAVAAEVAKGNLEGTIYTSPAGPITAIDTIYGWRRRLAAGSLAWAHKTGFTAETLGRKLLAVGFKSVRVSPRRWELRGEAYKPTEPVMLKQASATSGQSESTSLPV